jgi:hypothetical protein
LFTCKYKNLSEMSVVEDLGKLEPSFIAGGDARWCSYFGREFDDSSKW